MTQTQPRSSSDSADVWVTVEPGVWFRVQGIDAERATELMDSRLETVSARRLESDDAE
jgi:hypothetical protein